MVCTAGVVPSALASELIYQPINPSFGGNPFNSAHLLGLADRQNKYDDDGGDRPSVSSGLSSTSQGEQFVRQLQSRLLSGLASQVADAIFGENAQDSGEIVFGEQQITFARGLETTTIEIVNTTTGETSTIQIPTFSVDQ
jgi:curli production assembly/transport component CsgF